MSEGGEIQGYYKRGEVRGSDVENRGINCLVSCLNLDRRI